MSSLFYSHVMKDLGRCVMSHLSILLEAPPMTKKKKNFLIYEFVFLERSTRKTYLMVCYKYWVMKCKMHAFLSKIIHILYKIKML